MMHHSVAPGFLGEFPVMHLSVAPGIFLRDVSELLVVSDAPQCRTWQQGRPLRTVCLESDQ